MESVKHFFSYSRNDSEFVIKLATDLKNSGLDVWLDQLDILPGSRWDDSIETALKEASCLLVILSDSSVKSGNVLDEVSYALSQGKRVVPLLLTNCTIPFRIARLQHIDFTGNYDKAFRALFSTLKPGKGIRNITPVDNPSDKKETTEELLQGSKTIHHHPLTDREEEPPLSGARKKKKPLRIALFSSLAVLCVAALIFLALTKTKKLDSLVSIITNDSTAYNDSVARAEVNQKTIDSILKLRLYSDSIKKVNDSLQNLIIANLTAKTDSSAQNDSLRNLLAKNDSLLKKSDSLKMLHEKSLVVKKVQPKTNTRTSSGPVDNSKKLTEVADTANIGGLSADEIVNTGRRARNDKAFNAALNGYQRLAEAGNIDAMYKLGRLYFKSVSPPDYSKAVYWLKKATDGGNPWAKGQYGILLYEGLGGLEADRRLGREYILQGYQETRLPYFNDYLNKHR